MKKHFFYRGWTTILDYLLSRQIGDMYKCIIEAGKNVSHSKNIFTLFYLGAKNNLFCLFLLPFTRGHLQNTRKYDKVYIFSHCENFTWGLFWSKRLCISCTKVMGRCGSNKNTKFIDFTWICYNSLYRTL